MARHPTQGDSPGAFFTSGDMAVRSRHRSELKLPGLAQNVPLAVNDRGEG